MWHMITKIISVHRILMTQMYEPGTVGGRDGGPWRRDSDEGDEGEEMVVGGGRGRGAGLGVSGSPADTNMAFSVLCQRDIKQA